VSGEPSIRFYCRHCGGEVSDGQHHEPWECRRIEERAARLAAAEREVVEAAMANVSTDAHVYLSHPAVVDCRCGDCRMVRAVVALRDLRSEQQTAKEERR
jgi:hypothetical protein